MDKEQELTNIDPDIIYAPDSVAAPKDKYAVLSQVPYDVYQHDLATAQEKLNEYAGSYTILPELTDNESAVVRDEESGEIIISYRGTDPFNTYDLMADAQILTGEAAWMGGGRFARAQKKYAETRNVFPERTIKTTGHSLGGMQSLMVARKNDLDAVAFNPGASVGEIGQAIFSKLTASSSRPQTIFTTGKDVISASSYLFDPMNDNVYQVGAAGGLLPFQHSLDYFLPPKRFEGAGEPDVIIPFRADATTAAAKPTTYAEMFPHNKIPQKRSYCLEEQYCYCNKYPERKQCAAKARQLKQGLRAA